MPDIRITVDGRPALTTSQAAARRGITPAAMRKLLSRLGLDEVDRLDGLPLYDEKELVDALAAMPGKGVGGGRPRKTDRPTLPG